MTPVADALASVVLFAAIVSLRPVRERLRSLHLAHRFLLGTFMGLLLTAHLLGISRRSFPFVSWTMFSDSVATQEVGFYEYRATLRSGRVIVFRPPTLLPSLGNGRLVSKLNGLISSALSGADAGQRERAGSLCSQTLVALGKLYNAQADADPAVSVQVHRGVVDLGIHPADALFTLVWSVDVD